MIEHLLADVDACRTGSVYAHPLVEAVLGGSLHPGGTALTLELARHAGIGPGDHVLDVGCGKGTSAAALMEATGCTVTGVDVSETSVALARARHAGPVFQVIRDLADVAGPFDAIVSECTLCLQGDAASTLAAYQALLRPGGRLLLSDVTVEAPAEAFRSAAGYIACLGGALPTQDLQAAVRAAGFTITWHADRPELIGTLRDRIRSRVHVEAVLDALGEPGSGMRALVTAAESAYAAGHLGYGAIVARRASTSG